MVEAKVEHVAPTTVAFVGMQGAYAQIPQAFGTLYTWVASHGLTPAGMPRAVYLTDPASTPEAEARWEVQTPVAAGTSPQLADADGCGVRAVDAETHAVAVHRGPYETLGDTYRELAAWVVDHGFTPSGPPLEVYLSDPATTAPADYMTEVRFPVQQA